MEEVANYTMNMMPDTENKMPRNLSPSAEAEAQER